MAGNRRDLHISITGDDRGLGAAFEEAKRDAEGLDRELAKVDRSLTAEERAASRAATATRKLSLEEEKAALAARKMALEVKRAADQAEKAQLRSAAAAKAAERGILDKAKADKIAERADIAVERSAIKAAEAQLAQAAAAEKAAGAERKAADAGEKNKASSVSMAAWITSGVAAAGGLAAAVGAAGIAVAGFGALAAPSIIKVVSAQADLAKSWETLDQGQKASASSVHSLVGEYKTLAKSYEPDALKVFNGAVSTARGLLPELGKTVDATKGSVADFATSLENTLGAQLPRLFSVARTQGTPALNELGTTFGQTAALAVSLVQDLAPMGLQLLGAANGGLRLLNMLEQLNPQLVEIGATLLAVRAPANALGNLFAGGASKLSGYGKAASEAEKTTATLSNTVGKSPNLYIGAALAVGLLSYRWATAKSALDNRVDGIRAEASATKNSVVTHQKAIAALNNETVGWTTYYHAMHASTAERKKNASASDPSGSLRVTKAIAAEQKAVTNITQGENLLSKQYNITAAQAGALATAAGVDLSKGLTGSGSAAKQAQAKIQQYMTSLKAATDTTFVISTSLDAAGNKALDLKTRMAALDSAFGALAGPELQAYDSTTKTADAFGQMDAALKKSKGSLDLNTDAGRAARTAFAGLLSTVEENSKAQYQYESATLGVTRAKANLAARAKEMLPLLLAETHGSKAAANAVLDWANSQGLGKTRAEALTAIINQGKNAFLASATNAGISRAAAEKLWQTFNKLPQVKNTRLNNNAAQKRKEVEAYQAKLDALHGKTVTIQDNAASARSRISSVKSALDRLQSRSITITTYLRQVDIANRTSQASRARAGGGPIGYAHGGDVARMAGGGPSGPVVGPGSGTSDDIPVWLSNGEYVIREKQAKKHRALLDAVNGGKQGFANGGAVGYATGGAVTPLALSDVLQHWQDVKSPASASDVSKAAKARRTQVDQLKNAEDALYRARKRHDPRAVAAAERRIRKERDDLAAATAKLHDTEARYKYGKLSPIAQLDAALGLGIKDNATFIRNLQTLADRGAGDLANKLLAMGGPQAEKIAASAVKLSASKLGGIEKKIGQEQGQQDYMANLPNILTVRSSISHTKGGISSWVALMNATGLDAGSLADAVKLMTADLSKTPSGKALIADMHAHGFARGGMVAGPSGVDQVPARLTAGEFVMTRQATDVHRPLLEALNSGARVPVPARPAPAAPAAGGGVTVAQTYVIQSQDPHIVARESARELAWTLRG